MLSVCTLWLFVILQPILQVPTSALYTSFFEAKKIVFYFTPLVLSFMSPIPSINPNAAHKVTYKVLV